MKTLFFYKVASVFAFVGLVACSGKDDPAPVTPPDPDPVDTTQTSVDTTQTSVDTTQIVSGDMLDLHIDGRYLVDANGSVINLHGYTQTYSPYFNNGAWTSGDVAGCLSYNQGIDDGLRAAGWKFNFVRLHMDPVWSDDASLTYVRFEGHERFSVSLFKEALENVFIPMAEYYIENGEYVVMRPPGVCPEELEANDSYYTFLAKVWSIVASHPKIKNNMKIMFELANEPVKFNGDNKGLHDYFQGITDIIRSYCDNIIWVPGTGYQSQYQAYAQYPIEGKNIGYAVHCYPGWYGSPAEAQPGEFTVSLDGSEEKFRQGWASQVGCVSEFAPIMVTEIDWAPAKYNVDSNGENQHYCTWGSSTTSAFGKPFKKIADESGNVSWLLFTTSHHRYVEFQNVEGYEGNYTFMNDPQACPWPIWHWFKEYAETNGK